MHNQNDQHVPAAPSRKVLRPSQAPKPTPKHMRNTIRLAKA